MSSIATGIDNSVYTRPMGWITAIIVVLVVGLLFVRIYNKLIKQRNRVDTAWGHVDVQLQRRSDLIPNLVATVKGYASHESDTFQRVTEARGASNAASTPGEQAQADNFLTSALRQLFAVAEAYPELRASENFQNLQGELADTEDKIAIARQIYNDTVLSYNNTVQQIPSNIVAGITSFETREFYDAGPGAEEAPEVTF
jgi:LemA protein